MECLPRAPPSPYRWTGEWLSWSWSPLSPSPPFATPHGPSCLHFYHHGGVKTTDMTLGFEFDSDKSKDENLEALVAHVRQVYTDFSPVNVRWSYGIWNLCADQVRGKLLMQRYGANENGSFNKFTRIHPMHKQMAAVWAAGIHPTDAKFIPTVVCYRCAKMYAQTHSSPLSKSFRSQDSNPLGPFI